MTAGNDRLLFHKRQCSRRLALQAMYQWQFTNEQASQLVAQYREDDYWPKADPDYFAELINGCISQLDRLDQHIESASAYKTGNIDPVELAALRIAVYELLNCAYIPEKVIITEAIRLCKKFGSDEGFRLVNAILDQLIKQLDRAQAVEKN